MMVFQHRDGLVGYPPSDSSREVSDLFFRGFATAAAAAAVVFFVLPGFACVVVVGTFGCSLRGISRTLRVERALIVVLITIFFVASLIV
jgi:hypothetical protein